MASTTAILTGLSGDYQLVVRAKNSFGESTNSNTLSYTAGMPPSKMLPLTKSAATTTTIDVSWLPPSDTGGLPITGYTLSHDKGQTGTFTDVALAATLTTYQLTSITSG